MSREHLAFISGKFRVIHAGHIRLFKLGKELATTLVVAIDVQGLDPDEAKWRIDVLESIDLIDEVIQFNNDVSQLIEEVKPSFVIKGVEFRDAENIESKILDNYGGKLIFSSGASYFNESELIHTELADGPTSILTLPQSFMQRNQINQETIREVIDGFKNIKVCVIGDVIIDEYINCHALGMSQEEPSLVVTPIDSKRFLGGAGIVAAHCQALGAKTTLVSVLGTDETGNWCYEKSGNYGIKRKFIQDNTRPTTLKQRFRSGSQTLLKVSYLKQDLVSASIQDEIISTFEGIVKDFDLLIFSDFSYGTLTERVIEKVSQIAHENKIIITADSQSSSQIGKLTKFQNIDLITPTELEARLELKDQTSGLVSIAELVRKSVQSKNILLKLGADGVLVSGLNSKGELLPTDEIKILNKNAVDTSGAGDSMLAGASLSLAQGADIYTSALVGSILAGIQVSRIGNQPISDSQLISTLDL